MSGPEDSESESDDEWYARQRAEVELYLAGEGVNHGQVGEAPAWAVAPYVSVWAIESRVSPGCVGWWVIAGDLPTDYVSADEIKHPRDALHAFARRWLKYCRAVRAGVATPDFWIGAEGLSLEHVPMLESRARTLVEWAQDDSVWEDQ